MYDIIGHKAALLLCTDRLIVFARWRPYAPIYYVVLWIPLSFWYNEIARSWRRYLAGHIEKKCSCCWVGLLLQHCRPSCWLECSVTFQIYTSRILPFSRLCGPKYWTWCLISRPQKAISAVQRLMFCSVPLFIYWLVYDLKVEAWMTHLTRHERSAGGSRVNPVRK